MDSATQLELNAINRRFYAAIAPEWSDKRKHPWPGWERVLAALPSAANSGRPRVLDLGCGDGRLLAFLTQRLPDVEYLGIDASAALLERARMREHSTRAAWLEADFITQPLPELARKPRYDLICVFGVLHHVPAHARRVQLVRELASLLCKGGVLALTFWRLDEDPRFASRRVRFEDYNRSAEHPIALDQLEPGDSLLRWGERERDAPPRYCHFPSQEHTQALIAGSGLHLLERFRADGHRNRMNEYALLTSAHK
jgi:tRNA (uracil-5-)-methyltransferase TRM9